MNMTWNESDVKEESEVSSDEIAEWSEMKWNCEAIEISNERNDLSIPFYWGEAE